LRCQTGSTGDEYSITGAGDTGPATTVGVGMTSGTLTARTTARRRMKTFPEAGFLDYTNRRIGDLFPLWTLK
jgi:hypothetical protein